jgi:hypothetical protein
MGKMFFQKKKNHLYTGFWEFQFLANEIAAFLAANGGQNLWTFNETTIFSPIVRKEHNLSFPKSPGWKKLDMWNMLNHPGEVWGNTLKIWVFFGGV